MGFFDRFKTQKEPEKEAAGDVRLEDTDPHLITGIALLESDPKKNWDKAEMEFKRAFETRPDNSQVLECVHESLKRAIITMKFPYPDTLITLDSYIDLIIKGIKRNVLCEDCEFAINFRNTDKLFCRQRKLTYPMGNLKPCSTFQKRLGPITVEELPVTCATCSWAINDETTSVQEGFVRCNNEQTEWYKHRMYSDKGRECKYYSKKSAT